MTHQQSEIARDSVRVERLAVRLDGQAKRLIERAAYLECGKLPDYCVSVLTQAARQTIAEHETLSPSERARTVFFDTLIDPPDLSGRLDRAIAEHKRRIMD